MEGPRYKKEGPRYKKIIDDIKKHSSHRDQDFSIMPGIVTLSIVTIAGFCLPNGDMATTYTGSPFALSTLSTRYWLHFLAYK